jgi:hypothetical protein
MRPSRHFVSALFGVAMTLLAWAGPWEWPGLPAILVLERGFGTGFGELEYWQRGAAIVLLIAVNVGTWGLIANAVVSALIRRRRVDQQSA